MTSHHTALQEAILTGHTKVSPTLLSSASQCGRKGLLGLISPPEGNIHFDYGHAFGAAAAALFKYAHKGEEIAKGYAYKEAVPFCREMYYPAVKHQSGKTWRLLLGALDVVWHFAEAQMKFWDYHSSEVQTTLSVGEGEEDGVPYMLGGAYDLRMVNKETGEHLIVDFKAIQGSFMYSWPTEPQTPFYTILNATADRIRGKSYEWSPETAYYVHETKSADKIFTIHKTNPMFYVRHLEPYMKWAISKGKELRTLAYVPDYFDSVMATAQVNPHNCSRGGYQCDQYKICGDPTMQKPRYTANTDDRVYISSEVVRCRTTDIMETIRIMAEKAEDRHKVTKMEVRPLTDDDLVELNQLGSLDPDTLFGG